MAEVSETRRADLQRGHASRCWRLRLSGSEPSRLGARGNLSGEEGLHYPPSSKSLRPQPRDSGPGLIVTATCAATAKALESERS